MIQIVSENPGNLVDHCEIRIIGQNPSKVADLEKVFQAWQIQEEIFLKSVKINPIPFQIHKKWRKFVS